MEVKKEATHLQSKLKTYLACLQIALEAKKYPTNAGTGHTQMLLSVQLGKLGNWETETSLQTHLAHMCVWAAKSFSDSFF